MRYELFFLLYFSLTVSSKSGCGQPLGYLVSNPADGYRMLAGKKNCPKGLIPALA